MVDHVDRLFTVKKSSKFDTKNPRLIEKRKAARTANRRCRPKGQTMCGLDWARQQLVLTTGRLLAYACLTMYIGAYLSHKWVCRVYRPDEYGDTEGVFVQHDVNTKDLYCFGLWTACDGEGVCDRVWNVLSGVDSFFVVLVQMLGSVSLMGYGLAVVLDTASGLMLCACLAINRMVELCLAASAVIHFLCLLCLTGEVKNRARRVAGLGDQAGWGMALSLASLIAALLSTVLTALFRKPLAGYKHRRFWTMPVDLRPSPYFAHSLSSADTGVVMRKEPPPVSLRPLPSVLKTQEWVKGARR